MCTCVVSDLGKGEVGRVTVCVRVFVLFLARARVNCVVEGVEAVVCVQMCL